MISICFWIQLISVFAYSFRMVRTQVTAMKRALVDLWQLAFSYEVNPLAAVQPIAAAANQGR